MKFRELESYISGLPGAFLDFPFGEQVNVYKVIPHDAKDPKDAKSAKMFALVPSDKTPLQISLKCDPQLAVLLREKYESVMEGYHLNKKHWNTILLTGQLSDQEVYDLVLHSYNLAVGDDKSVPSTW